MIVRAEKIPIFVALCIDQMVSLTVNIDNMMTNQILSKYEIKFLTLLAAAYWGSCMHFDETFYY